MKQEELKTALDVLADAIADRIAQRLLTGQLEDWIDQSNSPLGPRRHRTAVNRRIAKGEGGAARVGRRHLLNREALAAELATAGDRKSKGPTKITVADDLRVQLRLVEGAR